jgi:hypothetical protein
MKLSLCLTLLQYFYSCTRLPSWILQPTVLKNSFLWEIRLEGQKRSFGVLKLNKYLWPIIHWEMNAVELKK